MTIRPTQPYGTVIDFGLLFVMILPNLVWVWTDNGIWVSDTSFSANSAIKLHHTLVHDTGNWWGEMLAIGPKPPFLPWLGQFFVPVGRVIGGIDRGLLLLTFIAQYVGLLFLYKTLRRYGSRRSFSLVACLLVAATPTFVLISRQFYAQPIQFVAVSWFLYIMAHAKTWDSAFTMLHIIAASSLAVLVMMSSPALCVIPGVVALSHVWANRKTRGRWGSRHTAMAVLALVVAVPTLAWYLTNFHTALAYSRYGYSYSYAAEVADVFVLKLVQWGKHLLTGFGSLAVVSVAVGGAGLRVAAKADWRGGMVMLLLVAQVGLAIVLFATSAQQTWRYVLPLAAYFAVVAGWGLSKIDRVWLTATVLVDSRVLSRTSPI